ncbi:hypothetical protein P4499_10665 [Geobacillus kaustophilus]|uniref:hypothetical protein n=1 Tax=Geobacillus kaustophilus TaxID=1462 RepID=UPI002E1D5AF0|nr:hypothetical protein [Geobacillus kaustophilus]MED4300026.1 hypothetical protein [Geobacillus stearothermophilus]
MIRDLFIKMGVSNNYKLIPESPIIRNNADTFFIGSAIMANMDLFEAEKEKKHEIPQKYITAQRVFSANRLEDVGKYPLATPFEVMLSIFRFGDKSVEPSIDFILNFLNLALGIDPSQLIYLAPYELEIRNTVLSKKVPERNVISWENNIPLRLGKNKPQGYYLKIFLPYKHGIIPISTIGFIEGINGISTDSALFLERLSFVKDNLIHWYESEFFIDLTKEVKAQFPKFNYNEVYLWANHLRTLMALYYDGVRPEGKGPGHTMRKIIRTLSGTLSGDKVCDDKALKLISAGIKSLKNLGYDITETVDVNELTEQIFRQINNGSSQIAREIKRFKRALSNNEIKSSKDLKQWNEERGLTYEWMRKASEDEGVYDLPFPEIEKRFWLRNECYSFDTNQKITDPVQFLKNAESKRMKGVMKN